jgi:DnaA family protein
MNTQLAFSIQLNDDARLYDFNWENNALLQEQITGKEQLLYLWGGKGTGKSHLLQACCQEITPNGIYLPLELIKDLGPSVIEGLEDSRLVCLDDIEAIANDPPWEEALFHLYNKIRDQGKNRLIISGKEPPAQIKIQLPDLRSRLGWGLVIQVHELSEEAKITTLKRYALKRGFELPSVVGQFLLKRCARNMHDLHELLNQLDQASLVAQRKITIPFVKSVLGI